MGKIISSLYPALNAQNSQTGSYKNCLPCKMAEKSFIFYRTPFSKLKGGNNLAVISSESKSILLKIRKKRFRKVCPSMHSFQNPHCPSCTFYKQTRLCTLTTNTQPRAQGNAIRYLFLGHLDTEPPRFH